jgi:aryl-alcohol dehydrogenase-like predicted oxidoreductase
MRLGKTGLVVSRVGIGGIPIPRADRARARAVLEASLRRLGTFHERVAGEWKRRQAPTLPS